MRAFPFLLLAYTMSQFYRSFLAILAGDWARDLAFGPVELGMLSAIWFFAFALAQFPIGYALDRFGTRRTMPGVMLLAVAGSVLLAGSHSLATSLTGMALVGMGCGPVLMGSMLYFAQNFPPGRFAQLCALIIGLGSLGGIAGSTPLALSAQAYGWRATILATGGLTLLAAALVFLVVRDASQAAPAKATQHSLLRAIAEQKGLWLLMPLTLVSYAVVIAERSLWIGPYFDKVHHLVLLERGNAVLAMAIAMALGALAYGPVERWCGGPKVPVVAGSLITATAFIALGLWPAPSVGVAVALLCVAGFAGLTYGTLMAHARLFFPPHLTGRGITFMNFLFIGGAGLGQTVSGPLVQYFGQSAGGGHIPDAGTAFSALHLAFGGALVLASLVYVMAPARRSIPAQKQPEAAQSGHPRG